MFGIPALKASIYGNIALGIALLAACGGWWLHAKSLRADVTTADAALTVAEGERDTVKASLTNLTKASKVAEGSIADLRQALKDCQGARKRVKAAALYATERLESQLQDANATLAATMSRYQAAMRDPECLICANRPVCPALVGP